jgi:glycosyltransferase involved in cell wall biosynthesis
MRVLHLYNSHRGGGGSDNAWAETIRQSRDAGIEVEVLARNSRDMAPGLAAQLGAALSGIRSASAIADTRDAIARFRPDVVHTHELYPLLSPQVIRAATDMGVPVVHACYDYRLTCPVATHFRAGAICRQCRGGHEYRAALRNCRDNLAESIAYAARNMAARVSGVFRNHVAVFQVFSAFQADWLNEDVGIAPDRIAVTPVVIPTPPEPADAAEGSYIAYAGRFVPEKGVEMLIEASRRTGLPVRLAGNAASHPGLRADDTVQCVMTNTREELAAFYRGARALAAPSLWNETFCIVAAEAMSHGVPVLGARVGALSNLVTPGETGLLFDVGDVAGLAGAMERVWHDPQLARRLGTAARAHVERSFNAQVHMDMLRSAYDRAIQRGVTPRR